MQISNHPFFKSHGVLLARILIGVFFLLAGIDKFQNIEGTVTYAASAGLPSAEMLVWAAAILETLAGAAIIVGYKIREAALLLVLFTIIVNFAFHAPSLWEESSIQKTLFMKNTAIIAGLLYIVAFGAGSGWSLKKKRQDI